MRSTDILIVDDEVGIREVLQETLEDEGYTVALAENAEEARLLRNQTRPAMVLLDIWMPDSDGITLLKEWAKNGQLDMPVVMMSGHGSIDNAVEATKIGALDFLEKPIPLQKLLSTVERALKHGEIQAVSGFALDELGNSPAMISLKRRLETFAKRNSVLLLGEPGSPFEWIARSLQQTGSPWVEPAKPEQMVEMPVELLQKASGGVFYTGDISRYSSQVCQSIVFLISKAERYNVRVVSASSRPLEEFLNTGEHNKRLLQLLSLAAVSVPPLREQSEDITMLVRRILRDIPDGQNAVFDEDAFERLSSYGWPGNLEQLRNVVGNLIVNAGGRPVDGAAVSQMLGQFEPVPNENHAGYFNFDLPLRELREELERRYFMYHIEKEEQNMSKVAQCVGLERTHLYRKLKQLGITVTRKSSSEKE